jgi:hypothetical protein
MPSKKPKKSIKSETPDGDQVLVRRVDAMMNVDQPEVEPPSDPEPVTAKPKPKTKAKPKPKKPAATKTAPKLSPKLLEGLETNYENEAPVEPEVELEAEPDIEPIEDPGDTDTSTDADPLEDPTTDEAVDDIVAHEGDTVLAVNDALLAREQDQAEAATPAGPRVKHKWGWFIFLIVVIGSAIDAYIFLSK